MKFLLALFGVCVTQISQAAPEPFARCSSYEHSNYEVYQFYGLFSPDSMVEVTSELMGEESLAATISFGSWNSYVARFNRGNQQISIEFDNFRRFSIGKLKVEGGLGKPLHCELFVADEL